MSGFEYKKYIETILNDSVPSAIQQCMPLTSSRIMMILVISSGAKMIDCAREYAQIRYRKSIKV